MTAVAMRWLDMDSVELPDDLYEVADRIEDALDAAAERGGITPSAAGRAAKVNTHTAGQILRWMVARQYAHTDDRGAWSRFYPGRPT